MVKRVSSIFRMASGLPGIGGIPVDLVPYLYLDFWPPVMLTESNGTRRERPPEKAVASSDYYIDR
jgi:hypothetical protein